MSTGTDIVLDALGAIGEHSIASPAPDESIQDGFIKLMSMLEMWATMNINIGFTPIAVVAGDINEPMDTRNGIVSNLALLLAPDFDNGGNIVSESLLHNARIGFAHIKRFYQRISIPAKVISSTTGLGLGNHPGDRQRNFFPRGSIVSDDC